MGNTGRGVLEGNAARGRDAGRGREGDFASRSSGGVLGGEEIAPARDEMGRYERDAGAPPPLTFSLASPLHGYDVGIWCAL